MVRQWVTGEPFTYTNWYLGTPEPNNQFRGGFPCTCQIGASEEALHFHPNPPGTQWNDLPRLAITSAYIVESVKPPPPTKPSGTVSIPTYKKDGRVADPNRKITVKWMDNSGDEDNFMIERSVDGSAFSVLATVGANVEMYEDTTPKDLAKKYKYQFV